MRQATLLPSTCSMPSRGVARLHQRGRGQHGAAAHARHTVVVAASAPGKAPAWARDWERVQRHRSPTSSAYSPMCTSPFRCADCYAGSPTRRCRQRTAHRRTPPSPATAINRILRAKVTHPRAAPADGNHNSTSSRVGSRRGELKTLLTSREPGQDSCSFRSVSAPAGADGRNTISIRVRLPR